MDSLAQPITAVPAGKWAVAVSGGADSVALLVLLTRRPDLSLHVVHLDHQARGADSTADAQFVSALAAAYSLPCIVARRSDIEPTLHDPPANTSSRYRAARIELFRRAVIEHGLAGVILAHHADDQAETVLVRLIRGSGPSGLAAMSFETQMNGLLMLRPLLAVRRGQLRQLLESIGQLWREDASNESDQYLRNRLRRLIAGRDDLHDALVSLADACRALRQWAGEHAPCLPPSFAVGQLQGVPRLLAREAARRWLIARGAPPGELHEHVLDRLVAMSGDAAFPPRQDFPGAVRVRRARGVIFTNDAAAAGVSR